MKKTLLKLMLLLCALVVGSNAWATEYQSGTIGTLSSGNNTINGISWNVSMEGSTYFSNETNSPARGSQFGSKNNPATSVTLSTSAFNGIITEVQVQSAAYSSSASIEVLVNGSSYGSSNLTSSNTTYTFSGSSSGTISIVLTNASTGGRAMYIKSIKVTYTTSGGGGEKTPCVDASTITLEPGDFDIKGHRTGTFVANGTKADAGATFSYSTTATSSLTVESDGAYIASAAGSYTVKVTATPSNSETYSTVVKNFDITLTDTRAACGLAFATSEYDADLGETFATPTLTNPHNLTVTYSSSPASVATVDASTGAVTLLKDGTVTITAAFAGNDDYKGGSASYTITVTDPNKKVFDFTGTEAYGSELEPSDQNVFTVTEHTWSLDGITLKTSGKYRWWYNSKGNTLRFYIADDNYSVGTLVVTAPAGKIIKNVSFTGTGGKNFDVDGEALASASWNAYETTSVTFEANATSELKTISVTIGDPTVTISNAGWATLYTPFAVDFSGATGLTAYTATLSGDEVSLTKVYDVPANTGVILKGAAGTYVVSTIANSSTAKGDLTGNVAAATAYDAFSEYDLYMLALNGDNEAQFTLVNEGSIAAGKAFLKVAKSSSAKVLNVVFNDDATGIEGVSERTEDQVQSTNIYDLMGRKVAQPTHGLYIVNGKKVFIK